MTSIDSGATTKPKPPLIYNPKVRGIAYQAVLCITIAFLAWAAVHNAAENLARAKIASGFGFWENTAGFDISQTLIDYSTTSTYGRAFWVGLLNTLLVAILGIVFATILGFIIGIGRLSKNWLVAKLAGAYVGIIRNLPLLLQLLFWYNAVLKALPGFGDQKARIFAALLGKQLGVRPDGWREAIGPYAEEGSRRSVADVTDETSLQEVRDYKKAAKAKAKAAKS